MGFFIAGFLITIIFGGCVRFILMAIAWVIGFILGLLRAFFPAVRM